MGRSRYTITEADKPHFLTCTIMEWLPLFIRPYIVDHLLNCWRYQQTHQNLKLYGYVVLENHLHFVAEAPDLNKCLSQFKSFTARQSSTTCKAKVPSVHCSACVSVNEHTKGIVFISFGRKAHMQKWCTAKR
jgi:hypothetical protein